MQEQLEQMDQLISYLAAYFCEDEKHFKIEECFKILSTFICRLRNALSVRLHLYISLFFPSNYRFLSSDLLYGKVLRTLKYYKLLRFSNSNNYTLFDCKCFAKIFELEECLALIFY